MSLIGWIKKKIFGEAENEVRFITPNPEEEWEMPEPVKVVPKTIIKGHAKKVEPTNNRGGKRRGKKDN